MAFEILTLGAIPQGELIKLAERMRSAEGYIRATEAKANHPIPDMVIGVSIFMDLSARRRYAHAGSMRMPSYEYHADQYERLSQSGYALQIALTPKAKHDLNGRSDALVFKALDFSGRQANVCAFSFRLTAPHGSPSPIGTWAMQGLWFESNQDYMLWQLSMPKAFPDPNFGQTRSIWQSN
ncbi:hypothetical protein [Rhizobium mongolense]|uniref:Uncharacterized protein n=2 Tax=Rhizobium mongolense TaxID=57676 RepID=A0ABR6IQQ1_9HYPH|nr:hypothetical protein [Rhizobium mongolense]MBB4230045.1 hypothetical protein [Rhizobium mongolense]TVZ72823.1 hypothetical protein BCL32_1010 [Rhizobium mongolense USDA 1844]